MSKVFGVSGVQFVIIILAPLYAIFLIQNSEIKQRPARDSNCFAMRWRSVTCTRPAPSAGILHTQCFVFVEEVTIYICIQYRKTHERNSIKKQQRKICLGKRLNSPAFLVESTLVNYFIVKNLSDVFSICWLAINSQTITIINSLLLRRR